MPVLRSYVSGRWTAPPDGRPVRDAVTGEEVALAELRTGDTVTAGPRVVTLMVAKEQGR
jgi:hypothetical protein